MEFGVSFKNAQIWEDISRLNFENPQKEFFNFFFEKSVLGLFEKKNKIEDEEVISTSSFPRKSLSFIKKVNEIYVAQPEKFIKFCILTKLEEQLKYKNFNEETFWLGKKYINKKVFSEIEDTIIKNFASKTDLFTGYESIHNYIKENKKSGILFDGITDKESLYFFKNNKEYGKFLANEPILLEHLMKKAISDAHIEKIKILTEKGVIFPDDKVIYSNLFLKTKEESLSAQKYIIEHCESITFGGQIILKTLLHSSINNNKIDLIQLALERYSDEEIEIIPKTLKRDVKLEVEFVIKFMEYKKLKKSIPEKNISNKTNFKL